MSSPSDGRFAAFRPVVFVMLGLLATSSCTSYKRWAYEGCGRDDWQRPQTVIAVLQLKEGDRVADLGAGGGYFTFRLAEAVGVGGKVYAVDVDDGMLAYLQDRITAEGHENVEVIRADYEDPLLPAGGVDMIFTSNTYHHLEDRTAYFRNAKKYLRPGGRVAVIDLNGEGWFAYLFSHFTPAEQIRTEMKEAGYERELKFEFLDQQSFQIFVPLAAEP